VRNAAEISIWGGTLRAQNMREEERREDFAAQANPTDRSKGWVHARIEELKKDKNGVLTVERGVLIIGVVAEKGRACGSLLRAGRLRKIAPKHSLHNPTLRKDILTARKRGLTEGETSTEIYGGR